MALVRWMEEVLASAICGKWRASRDNTLALRDDIIKAPRSWLSDRGALKSPLEPRRAPLLELSSCPFDAAPGGRGKSVENHPPHGCDIDPAHVDSRE